MVGAESLAACVTLELITGRAEQRPAGQVRTALYLESSVDAEIVALYRNGSQNGLAIGAAS